MRNKFDSPQRTTNIPRAHKSARSSELRAQREIPLYQSAKRDEDYSLKLASEARHKNV